MHNQCETLLNKSVITLKTGLSMLTRNPFVRGSEAPNEAVEDIQSDSISQFKTSKRSDALKSTLPRELFELAFGCQRFTDTIKRGSI